MSAQLPAAAWDLLPLVVQQHILMLTGHPSVRRVSKAWRDTFDAANDTLRVPRSDQNLDVAATAAVTRVIRNSASLTAINYDKRHIFSTVLPLPLSDLLAAGAASGLATRLRELTGVQIHPECAVQQLQALRQCTGLTHLDIFSSNPEDWLPEQGHQVAVHLTAALQGMSRLVRLCIYGFELRFKGSEAALASALQPLTQLQHLHVQHSGLGAAGAAALALALSAMPGLQTLDVSNNILVGKKGAEVLNRLLRAAPGLTHLDVSSTLLGDEGAELLAPVLRGMMCLQTLNLSYANIGDGGMAASASALAALPYLHTLDVNGNGFKSEAMSALQPVLGREGSPLRKLDIGHNGFTWRSAWALAKGLRTAPQLQELNLLSIATGDGGWVALAPALSCLAPDLQSLDLGYDSVDVAGSAAVALALQQLTGLTCLKAKSLCPSEAMVTIIPALMGMPRLQVLDLRGSRLSADGMAGFAVVLPALAGSLTHLDLSYCGVYANAAADTLAPALAQATGLVELHLGRNDFGPKAGQWLVPVLSALPHLHEVGLFSCRLGLQGCIAVTHALSDRDGAHVHLRENGVTASSPEGIALCNIAGINVYLQL